jgi:hypothetical protein
MTTVGRSANVKARGTAEPGTIVGSGVTTGRSETIRASGTGFPGTQVGSSATVGRSQVVRIPGGGISFFFDRTVWGGPFYTGGDEQYPADPLPSSAPFPLGPNVWTGYRATLIPALAADESTLAGWLNDIPPQPGGQDANDFPIWWDEPYTMLAVPVVDDVRLEDVEMFVVTDYEGGDNWYGAWHTMRVQDGRPAGVYPESALDLIISFPFDYGQSIDGAVAFVVPEAGDPDGRAWVVTGPTTDGFYAHVARVVPAFAALQDVEWTVGLWRVGEG